MLRRDADAKGCHQRLWRAHRLHFPCRAIYVVYLGDYPRKSASRFIFSFFSILYQ